MLYVSEKLLLLLFVLLHIFKLYQISGNTCLPVGQGKGLLYLEFKLCRPGTSSPWVFLTLLQVFSIYSVRVSMKEKLPFQLSLGIIQRDIVLKRQEVEGACFQKRNAQATVQPLSAAQQCIPECLRRDPLTRGSVMEICRGTFAGEEVELKGLQRSH